MGTPQLYGFDLIWLFIFLFSLFAFGPDFSAIRSNAPQISLSGHDIAAFGTVFGLYSIRISTFVAIIRKNRQPQVVEWWITIIGLSFAVFMFFLGGFFERPYVTVHGFKYCYFSHDAQTYVRNALPCPAPPAQ